MSSIADMPVAKWREAWTEIGHEIAGSDRPRMIPACLVAGRAEHPFLKRFRFNGSLWEMSEREMSIFKAHPPEVAAMCAYLLAAMTPKEFVEICEASHE